jgi:putative transposase
VRYIHRNPLHAGLVKRLEDYSWSSHKAYISKGNEGNWLHKDFVLSMLEENKSKRRQSYIDFMKQEESETLRVLYGKKKLPLLLGAKDFIDDIKQKYYDKTIIKEMPQVKELFLDKSRIEKAVCRFYQIKVDDLLQSRRGNYNEARNVAIYLLRKHTGASLTDISSSFGMNSYSSVSSAIMRIKQVMAGDKKLRQRITAVEKLLT